MTHKPHDLLEEFADKAEAIHKLKLSDSKFAALYEAYNETNLAIYRAETELEPTDDVHLEVLKKKRLVLKDEVAAFL